MACCGHAPSIKLTRKATLTPIIKWYDAGCRFGRQRLIEWRFYRNGQRVFTLPFAVLSTPIAVGTGSTYASIRATDAEIMAYLLSNGVTISSGQKIEAEVAVKNCELESNVSNRVMLINVPVAACACSFLTAFATTQTGNVAIPPGGWVITGGSMIYRNGQLNYTGLAFSDPLETQDELMFDTLTGCAADFEFQSTGAQVGNVALPPTFVGVSALEMLVWNNGVLQSGYTVAGSTLTPAVPSVAADEWFFARIINSTEGCHFNRLADGFVPPVNGALTFNAPAGMTSANQAKWHLVKNGLVMYPDSASAFGYSVNGSGQITLVEPAQTGDQFFFIQII